MAKTFKKIRNPEMRDILEGVARVFNLGAPEVDDVDQVVVSANMKVGAYTVLASPDVPRNISVSHTAVDAADTLGTIRIDGTNINDQSITETITPLSGTVAYGLKAFKTVTAVTGAGWVIGAGNDTITVGVGPALGLPMQIDTAAQVELAWLDGTYQAPTVVVNPLIEKCTVDVSAGTYNGSKKIRVLISE